MFKRTHLFLVLFIILLIHSNVVADNNDYVGWTWAQPTNLSTQVFTSADRYRSQIMSGDLSFKWNYITPYKVFVKSCDYRSDDYDLGKYISIRGAQLTGSTLATCGIYTKTLGIWIQRNFWTYTGTVGRAVIRVCKINCAFVLSS